MLRYTFGRFSVGLWVVWVSLALMSCATIPAQGDLDQLPFSLGDTVDDVKYEFSSDKAPEPFDSNYITRGSMLQFRTRGVHVFFNVESKVEIIRLEAPFKSDVEGLRIADSVEDLLAAKGQPTREPWDFNGNLAHVYKQVDGSRVRYDVNSRGRIETIFLIR